MAIIDGRTGEVNLTYSVPSETDMGGTNCGLEEVIHSHTTAGIIYVQGCTRRAVGALIDTA